MVFKIPYCDYHTVPVQYGIQIFSMVFCQMSYLKIPYRKVQYGIRKVQFGIFLNTLDKIPYRTGTVWYFFKNNENHENTILNGTVWYFFANS